jgi:omega-hydroxy-beta-dihydromenaquinone-9 sulfotransferase
MLWHGMNLSGVLRLISMKPALHWSRLHRTLSLPFSGLYNSALGLVESAIHGRGIRETKVEQPPLFVFGYWRSGTTLLQTLLSHDPAFQHLPLYRALFPWHFLTSEKLVTKLTARFVPKNRPMDNMKISWDAPQEDDMTLCIMSQVSPVMLVSHPQDFTHFWNSLDFSQLPAGALDRWKDSLHLLVKKLTYSDPRRVLMKSPFHMYHMPLLMEMFPDARFLYIHRNPYNVFRSAVHLRHRTIDENCLGRDEAKQHEEEIIKSYKFGFDVYQRDRELMPKGRLHEIAYEDLEQDPVEVLRRAYDSLELPGFEGLGAALQPELEGLKRYRKNQFEDDPYWVDRVYQELRPIFDHYGYEKPQVTTSTTTL